MLIWSLLKNLLVSKTLRRSFATLAIVAVSGDQIVKYVDKKHDEAVRRLEAQALIVEKRLDRKDINDDERHRAVMNAVQDLQASFKVIDARTYDLWKAQQVDSVSGLTPTGKVTARAYRSAE